MSNDKGTSSAPVATEVTVSGNALSGDIADNIKWNISNSNGNLIIYPNGTTAKWLYCTNTNNGVRVGDNTNKVFNYIDLISNLDNSLYGKDSVKSTKKIDLSFELSKVETKINYCVNLVINNFSVGNLLELAKKYSTDDSSSFVNGVLAKFVEKAE